MRAADFFVAASELPLMDLAGLTRGGGLVVVAPHPDDESLGCGGLIAAAVAAGTQVRLVVVSDGVGSHPNSCRYPPDILRRLREDETREAAHALGLEAQHISFLRLPDTAVPVEGVAADGACAAILAVLDESQAKTICVTWLFDPHCDHRASAMLVDRAVSARPDTQILYYPVWGWTLPPDADVAGSPSGLRFGIEAHRVRKAAAIACHRSQTTDLIDDDPHGFRLQPDMLAHFSGSIETFFFAKSPFA